MNVQYITDDEGKTTGVFIPISDWNSLKSKYGEINEENIIPESHKEVVRNRLMEFYNNPRMGLNYDEEMDDLKSE
jgi:hypothetical protein